MTEKVKCHLYLDIDDVINTDKGYALAKNKHPGIIKFLNDDFDKYKHLGYKLWDKDAVNNLRLILNTIEPEIYIHSSWQWHFKLKHFLRFFDYWCLDYRLIKGVVNNFKFTSSRYMDIREHIDGWRISTKPRVKACECYAIIDNLNIAGKFDNEFSQHQVVVSYQTGITEEDAKKAINILKCNLR